MADNSALLFYTDTARCADLLYFGRVDVHDPFIAFAFRKKKYCVVSALEFGRVRKESAFDKVLPLEPIVTQAKERFPNQPVIGAAEHLVIIASTLGIKTFVVPDYFPAGLANRLTNLGLTIEIAEGLVFPEREIKSKKEADAIAAGNAASAAGFAAVEKLLRATKIKGGKLLYQGRELTSETLQVTIETACLALGAMSANTIAAAGDQACDPHHRGAGPIKPNSLIIVDIFPRITKTGYYGDMTRTFLKGRASDAQRALVATVREAQLAALATVKAGTNGRTVHKAVTDVFAKRGYETKRTKTGAVGFFHGTGHGLGLDVHELPRMIASFDYALRKGSVVTVEPGLYYPGIGGARFEDVVQVTTGKAKMLSSYHYNWEIK